ncbi:MAG: S-layer homology domain-containing protein [Pseudanabaena sp. CRU_2_10]|nr:S-layer homology domain-containing protein [Pseudanabaena sp. CRU_2_10]
MHTRRLTHDWGLASVCLLLVLLTGCQNTGLGTSVETAIAPTSAEAITSNKALSQDFPTLIPVYRPTNLQDLARSSQSDPLNVTARWSSQDRSNQVVQFYRDRFAQNNWRTLLSPTESDRGTFLAQNSDLLVTVSVEPGVGRTNILLQYVKAPQLLVSNSPTSNPNSISASPGLETNSGIFNNHGGQSSQPSAAQSSEPFAGKFSDFDSIPAPLRPFIQDLSGLGILRPKQASQFEPNVPATRRQYAAWLVIANNRIYSDNPSRQIRLSPTTDAPIFTDVPRTDPDFSIIQGLANIGLINSGSVGKANNLFKPDAPLTREDLVLWKVPLDLRRPLPTATVEAVKQAWGFQDSDRITAPALRAILADFSAGDLSNIRRSFGYTTIFQPQKPVTRAEAAAALWYFGTPTDGLSAQRVAQLERSNKPEPQSSDSPRDAYRRATTSPSPQPSPTNSPTPNSKPDI